MKKISISLLLALALTACNEGNITPEVVAVSDNMSFNVLAPGLKTKVADNAFEESDVIGLYVTDYIDDTTPMPLQISGNRANNMVLTYDGAVWTPDKTIFWGEGKSDVYAYYPYICEMLDVESQYFEIATDQTGDGYMASDLLWAKAEGVKQVDGAVSLQMQHIMSKLTVKIVAGEDYVGSLPDDASVLLHGTATEAYVDFTKGSVSKGKYSEAKSIKMRKLGVRTYEGVEAVVYEAIVVPQMVQNPIPLIEINSKSVSYILEDSFTFRPGVAYTYTATLNTSTTAIKVDIGCDLEDWNNGGDGSGDGGDLGEGGGSGEGGDDTVTTDLSSEGTANCYLVQESGNYKFKAAIGNTNINVGNVKSVEVLWETFGTDEKPNVGDVIASATYNDGYVYFSTPENFRDGNALITVKNSKGIILWSWHIWCAAEGWGEQVYYNDAGIMMDRNIGATSATPGNAGSIGLMYQWGRKEPFVGSSSLSSASVAAATANMSHSSGATTLLCELNPMIFYLESRLPNGSWDVQKTVYDPCPFGWKVPEGGVDGVWAKALGQTGNMTNSALLTEYGLNLSGVLGDDESIYYPFTGYYNGGSYGGGSLTSTGSYGYCWSVTPYGTADAYYSLVGYTGELRPVTNREYGKGYGYPVRCIKE